jgi:formylglycine-generating enzyme required for sulfatase activity
MEKSMDAKQSLLFFSYAHAEAEFALKLAKSLRSAGANLWIDQLDIQPGDHWDRAVEQALTKAESLLIILSPDAVDSKNVMDEVSFALEENKRVVPVLYKPCKIPFRLRRVQHIDFTGDFDHGLERLLSGLAIKRAPEEPQTSQPVPAERLPPPKRPGPEEESTAGPEPVAIPRAIPTEPPAHEPAPPKPEPLKAHPKEPEAIKPESAEPRKKRNNFLIGVMITVALAIVVGLALWSSQELPRLSKTRPAEPPVAKAPTQRMFTNSIGMGFVLIPAGSFKRGSPAGESGRYDNERRHLVTISKPFYLQTTEVTQKQWRQVMGSNRSYFKECGDDCPVEDVSWIDAQEFIQKLNQTESGTEYRLPTEAEWEYACRAGSNGRFCFGNDEARLGEHAWYWSNSGGKPHPVGKKKPNIWGLYDMHGNVREWCQDWYGDYPTGQVTDPAGPKAGKTRVFRGGSFNASARELDCAFRLAIAPGTRTYFFGLRVARNV